MSAAESPPAVVLFLGDASIVDPLVHSLVDERLAEVAQSLDFEVFRFGERPITDIEASLRQVGMFSARRCIWLRSFVESKSRSSTPEDEEGEDDGDSLETVNSDLLSILQGGVPDGSLLVVSASALDARGKLFKWFHKNARVEDRRVQVERGGKLSEDGLREVLEDRLRELGVVRIGGGALHAMMERSGTVVGETLQEVDRLVLSLADPTALDLAAVRRGMRDLSLGWVFDLTTAIEQRDLAVAERLVERMLAEGEAPLRLCALLASQIGQLAVARSLVDGLPPRALQMQGTAFLKGPAMGLPAAFRDWRGYFRLRAASNFRKEELHQLHGEVLRLDLALKSSPAAPGLLFSRFLQAACVRGT